MTYRKNIRAYPWAQTQISIKERRNFIYISLSLEEHIRDDWFIVVYSKKDKSVYCVIDKVLGAAIPFTPPFTLYYAVPYYMREGLLNKISVDQFKLVMDVTRSNYAQFDMLINRLCEMNRKNTNANV